MSISFDLVRLVTTFNVTANPDFSRSSEVELAGWLAKQLTLAGWLALLAWPLALQLALIFTSFRNEKIPPKNDIINT